MTNSEIATTIVNQLGGSNRLSLMLGASTFVAVENGVVFKIGRNPGGVNCVKVAVMNDLYFVDFLNRKHRILASANGIGVADLGRVITEQTGLALSLGTMGR